MVVKFSKRPIEYVDEEPVNSLFNNLEQPGIIYRESKVDVQRKKRRTFSTPKKLTSSFTAISTPVRNRKSSKLTQELIEEFEHQQLLSEATAINCETEFSAYNIFSSHFNMLLVNDYYHLNSCSMNDLLHYCILHSGQERFCMFLFYLSFNFFAHSFF